MSDVLLRPEEVSIRPAATAVKAPDELAALGLDWGPCRPKSLAIRAKEDCKRAFTRRTEHYNRADASANVRKSVDTTSARSLIRGIDQERSCASRSNRICSARIDVSGTWPQSGAK
jgi:hypothetical protein